MLQVAVSQIGDARSDWTIIRALSEVLGHTLPYSDDVHVNARLAEVAPSLAQTSTLSAPLWLNGEYFKVRSPLHASAPAMHNAVSAGCDLFQGTNARLRSCFHLCVQAAMPSRTQADIGLALHSLAAFMPCWSLMLLPEQSMCHVGVCGPTEQAGCGRNRSALHNIN